MKNKIIGYGILALVVFAFIGIALTAFGSNKTAKAKAKPVEAKQYTGDEATEVFKQFVVASVGNKGTVLGAGCVPARAQADGTYAAAETGPVYGCIVAVASPGSTDVAECDSIVIRLVKPATQPEVLNAQAIDPKTCTG